ncbi:MAG: hypothetical protein ACI4EF_09885 [Coprococcus sp.]
MKRIIALCICAVMLCSLAACGGNNANNNTNSSSTETNNSADTTQEGTGNNNGANNGNNGNSGNNNGNTSGSNIGNDIGNAIDDVGNAVDDVANGVGDAVSGVFNTYDDAYDHFMKQLPASNNKYEVRNNDKDLTEYTSGKQGYHFELHDNTLNENSKIGDFYLDVQDGKIYHSTDNGQNYSEYNFSTLK